MEHSNDLGKCPFHQKDDIAISSSGSQDWWPKSLNLDILSQKEKKTSC